MSNKAIHFPESAEVVIVGAGVAGISAAWFLHQAGVKVVVCEKGVVAGEQSSRNWGWIRQQGRVNRQSSWKAWYSHISLDAIPV